MNAYLKEMTEEEYEEQLNEIYGEVEICGMTFDSGRVLKELDPIAFNCGMSDVSSEYDKWICGECEEEYDTEEEAEECCNDDD